MKELIARMREILADLDTAMEGEVPSTGVRAELKEAFASEELAEAKALVAIMKELETHLDRFNIKKNGRRY